MGKIDTTPAGLLKRMSQIRCGHNPTCRHMWPQMPSSWCDSATVEAYMDALATSAPPAPQEPCIFASIEGVAACGAHNVPLWHVQGVGWRCSLGDVVFPWGTKLGEPVAPAVPDHAGLMADYAENIVQLVTMQLLSDEPTRKTVELVKIPLNGLVQRALRPQASEADQ